VALTNLTEGLVSAPAGLRNEPVQARSTARLTALLDAAAAVVDEIGYERLTTAMVAERAGASIGTVYRYFPDRIAVLQALSGRNFERVIERVRTSLADPKYTTWMDALSSTFDIFVDAFTSEPGFASLRTGDVLDLRPATTPTTRNSEVAEVVMDALVERFDLPDTAEGRIAFEAAIETTDALVARAFARDPQGDRAFLTQGRFVVKSILVEHFSA
jgi:AcrR family transcriptional regulator